MKAALAAGQHDDATVAAALDVLREEDGCSLLEAVLEVARIHRAVIDAKDMVEARKHLATGSPIKRELHQSILAQCLIVPAGGTTMLLIVDGDSPPQAANRDDDGSTFALGSYLVSVGASWVKREASRLQLEQERSARRPRSRRSR